MDNVQGATPGDLSSEEKILGEAEALASDGQWKQAASLLQELRH